MKVFTVSVEIKASPEHVMAVLRDVERWPEWTSTMKSIRRLDGGPFTVGSTARVLQPKLRPAIWKVTELHESAGFTWVTRYPGVHIEAGHAVESVPTGSRVTLSLRFSGLLGPLVAHIYRNLNQQYLATEADGLKKRSE